jgi:hypothetical protein
LNSLKKETLYNSKIIKSDLSCSDEDFDYTNPEIGSSCARLRFPFRLVDEVNYAELILNFNFSISIYQGSSDEIFISLSNYFDFGGIADNTNPNDTQSGMVYYVKQKVQNEYTSSLIPDFDVLSPSDFRVVLNADGECDDGSPISHSTRKE